MNFKFKLNWTGDLKCKNVFHVGNTLKQCSTEEFSVWLFATPWSAALQVFLSITNSRSPPKPTSIESVMLSNQFILCRPLLLLPSIFPSIRVFSNESALCMRWPKYWSFSFNISPSNEHPGLISFRMDWLDLRAVQGTLKSLLQRHSSKASIWGWFKWAKFSFIKVGSQKTMSSLISQAFLRYYLEMWKWQRGKVQI